ncbi:MAG TPA: AraC family transcriptional regulator [Pilimelia sp.]|nr:AraC family transcriptional regulator [Pilimelia sp.]
MVGFGQLASGAALYTTTLRELPAAGPRTSCLDHDQLILVTAGHGTLAVDFVARRCRPGTLLWVRPGQVVGYGQQPGLDAILIGWAAELLATVVARAPALADPLGPSHWQLAGEDEDAIITEVSQLVVDCRRRPAGDLAGELLRHQLAVLLLRVALLTPDAGAVSTGGSTFVRFRQEVERAYRSTRRVEDYATRLGCSVRTLTRSSLAATGRSAKQVVDDRAALEARRLLACTDLPVAEVGQRLGFPEPTNFGRFFHREVGCSPGAFRSRLHRPRIPLQRQSGTATEAAAGGLRSTRAEE